MRKGNVTKKALLFWSLMLLPSTAPGAGPEDSVVKVLATQRVPSPFRPWANGTPTEVMGSGAVIDGQRILTNAHLVLYATDVSIQAHRGGDKIEAKIQMVAPDLDLAVLSVKEAKFFDKHPALRRDRKLPKATDNVAVYGFPIGGNGLAVTKGVVSRLDYGHYFGQANGLIVQVSAAINPGNSGGPALVGDRMIGLVFSRLGEGENIGYLIPNEEIDFFLENARDGRFVGKPIDVSGVLYQRCENKTLRRFLKLDDGVRGVLVQPPRPRPVNCPFEDYDVLTRVGGFDLDNEGMVQHGEDMSLGFDSVICKAARNGAVPITVMRRGRRIDLMLPVSAEDTRLVRGWGGTKPSYFIHGPLVFSPLSLTALPSLMQARPDLDNPRNPVISRLADHVRFPGEELVVVTSPMFNHKIAKGYNDPVGQVVKEVNGTPIKNLKHLVELLRDCTDEYLRFRFMEEGSELLVFRREEMNQATNDILEDNGISASRRGSPDVLKVWKERDKR
jgi:S1-C subfamily serine protease